MSLAAVAQKIQQQALPHMQAVVGRGTDGLAELLREVADLQCTPEEFTTQATALTASEARTLLTATLHRTLAYGVQILPLEDARALAQEFLDAAGPDAKFFSTSHADDEMNGVASWSLMVTSHTFESVLYCIGEGEAVLLVEVDED